MRRDEEAASGPVLIPGVVSLSASSRRTLKHGDTFCMTDEFADLLEIERSPAGVFHKDTRHLSRFYFTIQGQRPLILSSTLQPDNLTLDVDLTNADVFEGERLVLPKDTLHVARAKFLWNASWYEVFNVTSYADRRLKVQFAFDFAADFADLFEIRGHHRPRRGPVHAEILAANEVAFRYGSLDGVPRSTRLCFHPTPSRLEANRAEFELELGARERATLAVTAHCVHGEERGFNPRYYSSMREARHSRRQARASVPEIETSSNAFNEVLARSAADLAMLLTQTPQGPYPYAGVPWFSTAFGRDGLITAIEMLWFDPAVARGVLMFLAQTQGTREDPAADMEPGKILHEVRDCELANLGEVPFKRYYGSIDSTPLFIVLAGLYWKRTRDRATIEAIWPNVKAGLAWMDDYGDSDGDGFLEYGRKRESGLRNQGWKDSDDAVFHADGRLAEGPIALCEVQGYAYLARCLAAQLALDLGERPLAVTLEMQAERLRERFEEAFWSEELGTYALALDGHKQPCNVRTSNAGQVLCSGIARPERAARVAEGLFSAEFFTGWGIRTVSAREKRFNPASYHNGSVWPHDNALIGLGLARYGHAEKALALTTSLFDAAARMHLRRLPELFCGFPRKRGKAPTLYPVACAPQAWAACTPFSLIQGCVGMEIDAGAAHVVLRRPRLPRFLDWLAVRRLRVGDSRIDLMFRRHDNSVAVNLVEREGDINVEVAL